MARTGVTYDMIANAAAAIKARGSEPTISAVRVELNNEGSFSTISQHLAKWREMDAEKVDIKSLPEEVEKAALTSITTIWNVATKMAGDEIKAIKQDAKDQQKRMAADYDQVIAENKILEDALERETENSKHDRAVAQQLKEKLTAVNSELETIKKLYAELIGGLKQQAASAPLAAGTKPAHPARSKAAPENKQADAQPKK